MENESRREVSVTLSASSVNSAQIACFRTALKYLLATILCAAFGAIYELFSHGVYAWSMIYAFLIPLIGGVLPVVIMGKYKKNLPSDTVRQLWSFGISALTVGCLFSGALEIYGTTSRLTDAYWLAGGACLLLSLLTNLFNSPRAKEKSVVNP